MAKIDLTKYGITGTTEVVYNPSYEMLFEEETKPELEGFEVGQESELGAVNVMTGVYTGRSPKDKFIVMDENSKDTVWWTSDEYKNDNHPATEESWKAVKDIAIKELSNKRLFVVDAFCGANKDTRMAIRFIVEVAWQAHFVTNMFIQPTAEELENNLGTIANSGSFAFKKDNDLGDDVDIIGQFGVGFYSTFMVAKEVTVVTKAFGSDQAYKWTSDGVEGYTIEECDKPDGVGTTITLKLKDDTDDEKYSTYLDQYQIQSLVKKYSDYIRFPIRMEVEHTHYNEEGKEPEVHKAIETLNSMTPIWKKNKSELKDEDYNNFYMEKFGDYEPPIAHIHSKNIDNITKYAKAIDTAILVKNAPSYAALGFGGEGYCTFTIASRTGEGLTCASTFTKRRRCVMADSLCIR